MAAFLYIMVSFSVEGVGSLSEAIKKNGGDPSTALADVYSDKGMQWMSFIITFSALFGLSTVVLSNLMGQARVLKAFAQDGLIFEIFKEMDPKTNVPVKGCWISSIICAIQASFLDLNTLATLSSIGCLVTYAIIDAAVIQMRFADIPKAEKKKMSIHKQRALTIAPWTFIILSVIHGIILEDYCTLWSNIFFGGLVVINYLVLQVLICQYPTERKKLLNQQPLLTTGNSMTPITEEYLFRCPLVPFIPCLGIWTNCVLCTMGSNKLVWILFGVFELVGILFYVFYGRKHSKLQRRVLEYEIAKFNAVEELDKTSGSEQY